MTDPQPIEFEGVKFYDLRSEQSDPHPKGKTKNGKTVRLHPPEVDSIVLHQTAVKFGAKDELALARRCLKTACHVMAFHDGFIVQPTPIDWYLYHADALNKRSLCIEVDGNYPGLMGGKIKNDKAETPLTEAVIKAARAGVKLLVEAGRAEGMRIEYIYAHRQTDSWRRADPGEALWRKVALEYAVDVLGLKTRPAEFFEKKDNRTGKPIPTNWDRDGVGDY
ncbi:N-acetylmuramoyl-L-alanine amidase, family 2 [Plesiocystis pacifica SIR-1]|uniref:N-acetylmuramoyl-L-alanine amidase, family 2 n=1 Tax=Plesiocystis pacifica SIR-1 TaxID=391625 RepID=A6GHU9_9BACT|nr:N-acetylmuramoyl-L-alanine amidase [Plesiocystis pacifica]EDM74546.1 N-acetylmuramoyl-L-alanine amidase, family 2 [Plesiocystis pacifica SIR-1]